MWDQNDTSSKRKQINELEYNSVLPTIRNRVDKLE